MNEPPQPNPSDSNNRPNQGNRLWRFIKRPSTVIITGSILAMGIIGYTGGRIWLKRNLPSILETQISNFIQRPVEVGEIQNLSLNRVTVDSVVIPETATDSDRISINEIDIRYNILRVIIGRSLKATVKVVDLQAYLEEEAPGKWIELKLPERDPNAEPRDLPIELDVSLDLENTDITLQPLAVESPIEIGIDGEGRYQNNDIHQLNYLFNTEILQSQLNLAGETDFNTGASEVKLESDPIKLAPLLTLIPNNPVELNTGTFEADLNAQIAPLEQIEQTEGQGRISLDNLQGQFKNTQAPITADALIIWEAQSLIVQEAVVALGELQGQLQGEIDWEQGYQLVLNLDKIDLARLPENFGVQLPVPLAGQLFSEITITGEIKDPQIRGEINNSTPIEIDKLQLSSLSSNFQANLSQIQLEQLEIIPVSGGIIEINAVVDTQNSTDWQKMPVQGNLTTELPIPELIAPYYSLDEEFLPRQLSSFGIIQGTLGNPEGKLQWKLEPGESEIAGTGEILLKDNIVNVYNTNLNLGSGNLSLEAISNINQQTWSAQVNSDNLIINELVPPNLLPQQIVQEIIVDEVSANFKGNYNLEAIDEWEGEAVADVNINQSGRVNLVAQLQEGLLNSQIAINDLSLQPEIEVRRVQADLSIPVNTIREWRSQQDLSELRTVINAQVELPEQGIIETDINLANNQWQSQLQASQVQIVPVSESLGISLPEDLNLEPLSAQIQANGDIRPLLVSNPRLPINLNQGQIQLGETNVNTNGNIELSLVNQQLEIEQVNLDIDSNVNLDQIPTNVILTAVNLPSFVKPTTLDLSGQAIFNGQLQGEKLLSQPLEPGNLYLGGELILNQFSFNQRQFDPQLRGPVIIDPGSIININLQGEEDVVAFEAVPCELEDCLLPYLPESYALRQGEGDDAIIVSGTKQGTQLVNRIAYFPLGVLQLEPGKDFNVPGVLRGAVSADVVVDLNNLATNGNLQIDEPGLGYLRTKLLAAEFDYNPETAIAQISNSSFQFKDTEYNLQAAVNLESEEIEGKLDLNQNEIADIFETLQWSNINDVLRLISPPVEQPATSILAESVGKPEAPLSEQINLLWSIAQKVRNNNQTTKAGGSPLELDIRGEYEGEVVVEGTLSQPEVDINFLAQDWQWRTKPETFDVIEGLGLIQESSEIIPIELIKLDAELRSGVVNVEPLLVQISGTEFQLNGDFSLEEEKGQFNLNNLSLDLINQFVSLPVDATGAINVAGTISGSLEDPKVLGTIEVVNTTWSGKPLLESLQGEFAYQEHTGTFNTTFPEAIDVAATVPSPLGEGQGVAKLDVKISREVFYLLEVLTQGQLIWQSGEGEIDVTARLPLDWSESLNTTELIRALRVNGLITFKNSVIENPLLDAELELNGEVALEQQRIKIDNLSGELAESQLLVTGVFPLVRAIEPGDPDFSTPLKIQIQEGRMDLESLYEGNINGEVLLTGTALGPVIGGKVLLSDGRVYIPQAGEENPREESAISQEWLGTPEETEPAIPITLQNFVVNTENLDLAQFSLYKFNFGGQLVLNGELTEIEELDGNGQITLNRGEIIFFNTQFFLAPRHNNTITFRPRQGVLNPRLDIQMQTSVAEAPDQGRAASGANEIRDDLFRLRSNSIRVTISVDGNANQIIPSLGRNPVTACQLRDLDQPTIPNKIHSPQVLEQLQTCVQLTALADADQSNGDLLESPAVSLSSEPSKPNSEIIELLAGQFLAVADQLDNATGLELLQLGADQFVIGPLFRDTLFSFEQFVNRAGRRIGLQDLRAYPVLETVYSIANDSSVRISYDYFFNEGQVRYQRSF